MLQKPAVLIFITFLSLAGKAQMSEDTATVTLPQAEKMFLDSNLQLLAQKYNIDAQQALIIQARLWPNPNLSLNRGPVIPLYDAQSNYPHSNFFLHSENSAGVSQLILLAGKGYISEKEVIRIRAQLYSFRNEYNDLINQINDIQSELRLVLQLKPAVYINPLPDSIDLKSLDPDKYSFNTLIDSAYNNRTDLQIARTNTNINKLTYSYQKALAVPDLTASFSYDRQGSYATNFNAVGLAMDLPFFNRNQGNIRSARSMVDYSIALQKTAEATVEENVARSLQKAYSQNKLYQSIDPSFSGDFERLMN